jgi:hypothetical protein
MEYMHITVSYSHSAFPEFSLAKNRDGLCRMQSRHDTSATASLKLYNPLSLWSPRPVLSPSPLYQLVKRHWGVARAEQAVQEMVSQRSMPRKPARTGRMQSFGDAAGRPGSTRVVAPLVPLRKTSRQRQRQSDQSTVCSYRMTPSVSTTTLDCDGGRKRYSAAELECSLFDSRGSVASPRAKRESLVDRNSNRRSSGDMLRGIKSRVASGTSSLDSRDSKSLVERKGLTQRILGKKESGIFNWGSWF